VSSLPALAQNCVVTRDQLIADLRAGLSTDDLEQKYAGCIAAPPPPDGTPGSAASALPPGALASPFAAAAGGVSESVKNTGSVFWEAIKSCGYHPQREEADCAVEIRQRFGFGGPICQTTGSHEFLLFCADLGSGLVPINTNGIHLHDERFGVPPAWSLAATIQSNARLLGVPNDGRTLRGRVILSWQLPPTNCNYIPIWGNQSDFRFRLDP